MLCAVITPAFAQDIPTPGHKCVYNCDAPPAASSPMTGYGAAMGSALGAAIVRSWANQQQQQRNQAAPVPDNGQSNAARQSLEDWANGGSGQATYSPPAPSYSPASPASELDQWANQVQSEDLRDAPNSDLRHKRKQKSGPNPGNQSNAGSQQPVPSADRIKDECVESGQIFDKDGRAIGEFYQCWPKKGDKYCLNKLDAREPTYTDCNTQTKATP